MQGLSQVGPPSGPMKYSYVQTETQRVLAFDYGTIEESAARLFSCRRLFRFHGHPDCPVDSFLFAGQ